MSTRVIKENRNRRACAASARYKARHPDKVRHQQMVYRITNREARCAAARLRYQKNKLSELARAAQYRRENPEAIKHTRAKRREKQALAVATWQRSNKEKIKAIKARYHQKHPQKRNMRRAAYKADRLSATPSWANQFFIEEIYDLAQLRTKVTGIEWHVDHIVPLRSPIVSGLHVEHNLRVIPKQINLAKGNRHWPDMPGAHIGR